MQQALEYAEILDVPFAYSSNGDAFLEHDRTATSGTVTREIPLDQFPTPDELWARYCEAKGYTAAQEAVATQDYFDDGSRKSPRYYQLIAINRTVDAIARGENRILLVMATGTGKTYTAFQIIWRLWKSGPQEAHPLPRRPQHPRRPDQDQRLQAVRHGDDQDHQPHGGQVLRDLPLPLPGRHRHRGRAEHLQAVLARLLRPGDGRRVPPRQRRRRCRLAPGARILLLRHPDRPHRHAQGNRRTSPISSTSAPDLHLLPASRASPTASSPPTRSSASASTRTSTAGGPRIGQTDKYGQVIEDREYNDRDFDRNLILEKRTENSSPPRSPSSSRPPTASPRPSSSARTSTTPSACGRRW